MERTFITPKAETKLRLHFNLKQTRDRDKLTQIMLVTTVKGQRIRVYTKLRIEPRYWDKKTCRCVAETHTNLRERKRLTQVNRRLKALEVSVCQSDIQLANEGKYLSSSDVRKLLTDTHTCPQRTTIPITYLYQLIADYPQKMNRRGKRGIPSTQKTYFTALKRLENFCRDTKTVILTFDDFDKKFFSSFADYLYSCSYKKGNEKQQYTQNTVINTLKVIKNLLHRAYDNEMTDNNHFQKVQTVLSADVSEQVYLEEKEINKLKLLKLTDKQEIQVRDMFIIACYTALRISDLQQLGKAIIRDGKITMYQTKTQEQVEIPILKEISSLLSYYQKQGFPTLNICKANKIIKELARRCSINDEISYKEHRGGVSRIQTKRKWEMISFHTARRSCITNLYKRGYPANYIMTLSGHHSTQAFQRYMRASNKELTTSFINLLKKEKAL